MEGWRAAKDVIEQASGVSMDALHVIGGTLAVFALALVLRTSLASWRPWLIVLLLLLGNEAMDLGTERWPNFAAQLGESVKDVALTMLLPTLVLLSVRFAPSLYAHRSKPRSETSDT